MSVVRCVCVQVCVEQTHPACLPKEFTDRSIISFHPSNSHTAVACRGIMGNVCGRQCEPGWSAFPEEPEEPRHRTKPPAARSSSAPTCSRTTAPTTIMTYVYVVIACPCEVMTCPCEDIACPCKFTACPSEVMTCPCEDMTCPCEAEAGASSQMT